MTPTHYRLRRIIGQWHVLVFDAADTRLDDACSPPFADIKDARAYAAMTGLVDADRAVA